MTPILEIDLVLDGCSAQASITDVHAFVTLSQNFINVHAPSGALGVYTFPLIADAVVCGFEMVRGDGSKVEGVAKEKEEAKREYGSAVSEGYTAGLGQQETGDIFSVSVWECPPGGNSDHQLAILLQLLWTMKRMIKSSSSFLERMLSDMGLLLQSILRLAELRNNRFKCTLLFNKQTALYLKETPTQFRQRVSDRSHRLPYRDIVLVITAAGLDAPRCFIEPHSSLNHETTAVALTFVQSSIFQTFKAEWNMYSL
ncbi:hypothetical protein BDP27DRAFT_1428323 [Rhodocollybia butyracea]|uniref:VIT domain-containing protein n=1 Tax=Rhodocollybia butyracea TaxID=206335 RepID=A0A9P5PEX0_9AGAR|nr:hypothetical protein BDP27DRAFT_1428323 [Rhodocollybia butyracea]